MLAPLSLAGFFENYDATLLTLAAPQIAAGLGTNVARFGLGVAVIRLAALANAPLLRLADRWGRRRTLLASLAGFSACTALTAGMRDLAAFVAVQVVARAFLTMEDTLAGVVIAEEVRPDRRGAATSLYGWASACGPGAVAAVLPLGAVAPLGWRLFYVAALGPLAIVGYLRRNLQETAAFEVARAGGRVQASPWPRVAGADQGRLWRVAGVVASFGLVQTPTFLYAADLAQHGYGWSSRLTEVALASGLFVLAGFYAGGRLSDRFGRRPMAALGVALAAAGPMLMFSGTRLLFAPGFFLAAAASACLAAVLAVYLTELFPTEVRATLSAFAVSCQVAAGSLGLALVSGLVSRTGAAVPLWALAIALPVLAVPLLRSLPETAGRDVIRAAGS